QGENDIRLGIAAVSARLRTGRLKVLRGACVNLLAEARLYRYPTPGERALRGENPVDEYNHALDALRYLVSRLDAHLLARLRTRLVAARLPGPPAPVRAWGGGGAPWPGPERRAGGRAPLPAPPTAPQPPRRPPTAAPQRNPPPPPAPLHAAMQNAVCPSLTL